MGDPGYWADSIEGVYLTDVNLVSMKLSKLSLYFCVGTNKIEIQRLLF